MPSEYQQTTEQDIRERVRYKYRASIEQLKTLNFEELCFFSETMPSLGLPHGLFGMLGVLAALPNEVSRIGSNLSASLFFLLMVSREYDTYVSPFGLGLKFYTSFTDGTCVITANFASPAIHDDKEKLYKVAQPCSIEAAWKRHQAWVNELSASGKQRRYHLSFEDYSGLACKEDSYMFKPGFLTRATFADMGSAIISGIISIGLLIAVTLTLLALPNVVHILYPACWFVRGLGKPPLPASLLITFMCIIFSWFLARIQKKPYTVDGIGTMLRGHTTLPDGRGYISTKWLVFVFLPILPVQSYTVLGEYSSSSDKKLYSMKPLNELDWAQIGETIWHFKIWYAIIVLLWIGFGVWALSQCI